MNKILTILIILSLTNSFHFNIKPIGKFFKHIYEDIKKPIKKLISKSKRHIKTDIISLINKIKNLPNFEKIKSDLKNIISFFENNKNTKEMQELKEKGHIIKTNLEKIKQKMDYIKSYPKVIQIYKNKNMELTNMLNSLKKQIDIDMLQNKKININVQKYIDELKNIQKREIISENLEREVERNLKEIILKQKKISVDQKKNSEEILNYEKNFENSKKIINDLKTKISDLENTNNEILKKNHEKEISKKLENLKKIKENLKNKEITKNQEDLKNLQKMQFENINNIKIMENGINEIENKKKNDMRIFKFNVDNEPYVNRESQDFLNTFKDIANNYLSSEE